MEDDEEEETSIEYPSTLNVQCHSRKCTNFSNYLNKLDLL